MLERLQSEVLQKERYALTFHPTYQIRPTYEIVHKDTGVFRIPIRKEEAP